MNSLIFMKFALTNNLTNEYLYKCLFNDTLEYDDKIIESDITEHTIDGYYITYSNTKELVFNNDTKSYH